MDWISALCLLSTIEGLATKYKLSTYIDYLHF